MVKKNPAFLKERDLVGEDSSFSY